MLTALSLPNHQAFQYCEALLSIKSAFDPRTFEHVVAMRQNLREDLRTDGRTSAVNLVLRVHLIGPFRVETIGGVNLTPRSKKARAILAMLMLSPRGARSRVWLRDKLWSDRGEDQAAASLRQALVDIRKALGPEGGEVFSADPHTLSIDLDAIEVDAFRLRDGTADARLRAEAETAGAAEHFLEGIDVRDPEFEDWLSVERQLWQRRFDEAAGGEEAGSERLGATERRAAARELPDTSTPHAVPAAPKGDDGTGGASAKKRACVALLSPSGGRLDATSGVVHAALNSLLSTLFLETGEFDIWHLESGSLTGAGYGELSASAPMNGTNGGHAKPDNVHLCAQVRVHTYPGQVLAGVSLYRPGSSALIWSGEVALPEGDAANGNTAAAHPVLVRAIDEALRYVAQHHHDEDGLVRLNGAVMSMFRLRPEDLNHAGMLLRAQLAEAPSGVAFAWMAFLNTFWIGQGFSYRDRALVEETQGFARRALELDPNNALVGALVGHVHSYLFGEYDYAASLFERSLSNNPAQTLGWDLYAMLHTYAGEPRKALAMANWASHLGGSSPHRYYFETTRCISAMFAGDHRLAATVGEAVRRERPDFNSVLRVLVSSYAHAGLGAEARAALDRLLLVEPRFSLSALMEQRYPGLDTKGGQHFLEGLKKAGAPSR